MTGTLQSGVIPIDLKTDLDLSQRLIFFGRLVVKPGVRHRVVVEGSPYSYSGSNALSRTIEFQGRTYSVQDTVTSRAEMTYVYAGYQYDFVRQRQGHVGIQAGGAYIDAAGRISSAATGLSASRSQKLGLPLVGLDARISAFRFVSLSADIKGMSFGGYGRFLQTGMHAGVGGRWATFQAGYMLLDADVHERNGGANRVGIAPQIKGPVFSVQIRY